MHHRTIYFLIVLVISHIAEGLTIIDAFEGEENTLSIPLVKMKSLFHQLMEMTPNYNILKSLQAVYLQKKNKPTNDTVNLFKYFDSEYYGIINIGKPGKQFKMIFDTDWVHSWVTSVDCPRTKLPCAIRNRYDHSTSSTYKKDGTPFNVSGEFIGYISQDVFLVGQMNSTDQQFAELSQLPWSFSLVRADGIIGLAFQNSNQYKPFFYNFVIENKINPIFSFYINRDPTTKHGGSILFGGIDKKHKKGEFTTVSITSQYFWTFRLSKVSVVLSKSQSVGFCTNGCTATADTSTNAIVGPHDDIQKINSLIRAEPFIMNRSLIPCVMEYKGPKINFTIGNNNFQILGRDYVQKISYSGFTMCLSAFQPASEASLAVSDWRLGGAFMYQFYTSFDLNKKTFSIAEAA